MRNPNGYGGVSKLKGNRRKPFVARITAGYRDTGTQIYKILGYFGTQEEAIAELVRYNETRYDIDQRQLTFAELYSEWSEKHFQKVGATTVNGYKTAYKRFESIHNMRFADLRTNTLQRVIDDCEKYSIRKSMRVLLNVMYEYADKNDIITKKYNEYIEIGKPETKHIKTPFTDEEIQKLKDNDNIDGVDTILILIYTGMRINELLKLKTSNIHLEERYWIGGSKTEAGKDRIIPLHKSIIPYIKSRYNLKNKYLLSDNNGNPIPYYKYNNEVWKPIMKQLGMKHTIHETRHTLATKLDQVEENKLTIKRLLGHATQDITARYTKTSIEQLINCIDKIE